MDVALASCLELPEPDPDAAPLAAALAEAGIAAEVLAWDDPGADWARARLTVLRSTWNYPTDREAFVRWAGRTAQVSELWNPRSIVRWNSHKRYLLELEDRGVPIVPTAFVASGSDVALGDICASRGWGQVIVKPAVSAASLGTRCFAPDGMTAGEAHLRDLASRGDVLVQRYLPSVESYGERALVWIDGELTHAVRKRPRFEGEDESVTQAAVEMSPAEARLARRAIDEAPAPIMYGRIDVAPGPDGEPVVMELELLEPSLYFDQCPPALDRFVRAIRMRLEGLKA